MVYPFASTGGVKLGLLPQLLFLIPSPLKNSTIVVVRYCSTLGFKALRKKSYLEQYNNYK